MADEDDDLGAKNIDMMKMAQPVGHLFTPAALMVEGEPVAAVQVGIQYVMPGSSARRDLTMMWRADDLLDFVNLALSAVESANEHYEEAVDYIEKMRKAADNGD